MKTLDEVINALEICGHDESPKCPYFDTEHWCCCEDHMRSISPLKDDALRYLKEYKKQKYIWKKLYLLAHQIFWGLEEEYPLDGERIANDLFDAYSEGFEDEDN